MKALNLANYIIWYANENHSEYSVTPLTLQKIIYYISVVHAREKDNLPFNESINKWQFGPVVSEVYNAFKSYGSSPIKETLTFLNITNVDGQITWKQDEFDINIFSEDFKTLTNPVIDNLIKIPAFELVEMTHKDDAWFTKKAEILSGVRDLKYTLDEIKNSKYPNY